MMTLLDKLDKALSFKFLGCLLMAVLIMMPYMAMGVEADTVDPADEAPIVVSLGDSYSSGEGIEEFYDQELSNKNKVKSEDWLAHRSQKSWPGMLEIPGLDGFTRDHKDSNWFFVASSGAKTKHLKNEQQKNYKKGVVGQYEGTAYIPPQLDIFDELEYGSVDYVTITIGGNDACFAEIIESAVLGTKFLDLSSLSSRLSKVWTDFYKEKGIRYDIYNSYKAIEKAAGSQAQIIVAGYPRLIDEDGIDMFMSREESSEINRAVSNFNIEIEKIVDQCASEGMKICFVSVEDSFDGHGAYASREYINGVILGTKEQDLKDLDVKSAYSMHPNYNGAIEYAECVNEKIRELAEEEAARLEYEALNPSDKDREVVLVLDSSGSMAGNPMQETKEASHKFVETVLKTETNIGVVYYDDNANVSSVLTDSEKYLDNAIDYISSGGGTNIESGLKLADDMLSKSDAGKKIIVLMSDGEPNSGLVGDELIKYADKLKDKGYYIYTLGFFSALGYKDAAVELMDAIASDGCHYEVDDAGNLVFFFGDIASQISGENYIYVKIACPVDVTVTYNGETMTSKDNYSSVRTSFGSMTFEDSKNKDETADGSSSGGIFGNIGNNQNAEEADNDDRVKILRLKEGVDYDIKIEGNGTGKMNYTIGFMDEDGEYTDMRKFSGIKITKKTEIDTVAGVSDKTYMYVDEDGDGKYDITYKATENGKAEIVDYSGVIYACIIAVVVLVVAILIRLTMRHFKIRKYL